MLLQRARVARRGGDRHGAAVERRRALAPHQRQQLEGVLEQVVAAGDGGKSQPYSSCSRPNQADAEPAERPPAGQHVERGDDLRQVGDVAVRDAVARGRRAGRSSSPRRGSRASSCSRACPPTPARPTGSARRGPSPRSTRTRPSSAARAMAPRRGASSAAPPGHVEAADLQAEAQRHRILLLAPGGGRRVVERVGARPRRRRPTRGARRRSPRRPVRRGPSSGGGERAQLARDHGRRDGLGAARLRARASRSGVSTATTWHGTPAAAAEAPVAGAHRRLEGRRVDDRQQAAAQALGDDQLEDLHGVLRRAQVVAVPADDGAQVVRRRRSPPARTSGAPTIDLPGPGDADEHHEARVGQRRIVHRPPLLRPCGRWPLLHARLDRRL